MFDQVDASSMQRTRLTLWPRLEADRPEGGDRVMAPPLATNGECVRQKGPEHGRRCFRRPAVAIVLADNEGRRAERSRHEVISLCVSLVEAHLVENRGRLAKLRFGEPRLADESVKVPDERNQNRCARGSAVRSITARASAVTSRMVGYDHERCACVEEDDRAILRDHSTPRCRLRASGVSDGIDTSNSILQGKIERRCDDLASLLNSPFPPFRGLSCFFHRGGVMAFKIDRRSV